DQAEGELVGRVPNEIFGEQADALEALPPTNTAEHGIRAALSAGPPAARASHGEPAGTRAPGRPPRRAGAPTRPRAAPPVCPGRPASRDTDGSASPPPPPSCISTECPRARDAPSLPLPKDGRAATARQRRSPRDRGGRPRCRSPRLR